MAKARAASCFDDQPISAFDHMGEGLWLMLRGKHAESLDVFLWCWDEGAEADPGFHGHRITTLLRYLKQLAEIYPPCAVAIEERKAAIRAQLTTVQYPQSLSFDLEALERYGVWPKFKFPAP